MRVYTESEVMTMLEKKDTEISSLKSQLGRERQKNVKKIKVQLKIHGSQYVTVYGVAIPTLESPDAPTEDDVRRIHQAAIKKLVQVANNSELRWWEGQK